MDGMGKGQLFFQFHNEPLPSAISRKITTKTTNYSHLNNKIEPISMYIKERIGRTPLPHQLKALEYCKEKNEIALFMEMRLGKTKVVIDKLKETSPVLVVAPLTVLHAWKQELEIENKSYAMVIGTKNKRKKILQQNLKHYNACEDTHFILINYEGVLAFPEILNENWKGVVLDESTKIKNPYAKITETLTEYIFNHDAIKIIMSGKPAPESPVDYFSQFKFLYGHFMGYTNFWKWREKHCIQLPFKAWVPKSITKIKIKDYVKHNAFIMTRGEVGLGNKKIYENRIIQQESKQKKIMETLEKNFLLTNPEGDIELETKYTPVQYIWMAQVAGGFVNGKVKFKKKYDELLSLLIGELKNEKVVVWFRFNQELNYAKLHLEKHGYKCIDITGNDTLDMRSQKLNQFKNNESIDGCALLMQMKVGLYGLDLSCSSTAIYFSNGFSLETRKQTEDRIESPTKKEPLLIIDLLTEGSIDVYTLKALKRKENNSNYYITKGIYEEIKNKYNSN